MNPLSMNEPPIDLTSSTAWCLRICIFLFCLFVCFFFFFSCFVIQSRQNLVRDGSVVRNLKKIVI
ncbi:hypothetical protein IEQ34_017022 [Dendrobium chrysotoxum]|uniref:ATP synthase F0 subunit 8 n=1 Tax=Dendrobium chrysotoxum TaxID=161865 RepID=A0AAV7GHA0_DENCH|nr:hypothetical protein IEQ34_017022 [Dendrobium chrysotoxum]